MIEKQQILIKKQARTIEKYERSNQLPGKTSSRNSSDCRNSSSLHDSVLDVSSDIVKLGEEVVELEEGPHTNLASCDETDSYITLSDSSLITSTTDDDHNLNFISHGVGLNPFFNMEIYENKSKEITNGSEEKISSNKLLARREKFVSTTKIVQPHPHNNNVTQIIIGDPEEKKNKARESVLQKSMRMLRKSKIPQDSFFKSKSEGNIKELVDNESKPSLLQSLYKGFTSSRNLKSADRKATTGTAEDSGFLSLRAEVAHLADNQRMIGKLSGGTDSASLPPVITAPSFSADCQGSLFSCFTAGSRPIMPNHRNVLRPRDIKEHISVSRSLLQSCCSLIPPMTTGHVILIIDGQACQAVTRDTNITF